MECKDEGQTQETEKKAKKKKGERIAHQSRGARATRAKPVATLAS